MGYYLKVRFKEKRDGRKIWYFNKTYLCDCINATFENKEDCEKWIPQLMGMDVESITLHKTRGR